MTRIGQNHTFIGIYGVYTVYLAGKSPYIRSYMVCIYGSGQPTLAITVYIHAVYDRVFHEIPAKITIHTPCGYGSGLHVCGYFPLDLNCSRLCRAFVRLRQSQSCQTENSTEVSMIKAYTRACAG